MSVTPFERDTVVDKPGIVGARWWHSALEDEDRRVARRAALKTLLGVGVATVVVGGAVAGLVKAARDSGSALPDDVREQRQSALQTQREYGWDFGSTGEPLVFDGSAEAPFDAGALTRLVDELEPTQATLKPFYQPTLFQAPYAMPTMLGKLPAEETAGFKPLVDALKPLSTPAMESAYARGQSLASLFLSLTENGGRATDAKTALIIDLPGPEAVAFAAGAARVFDPVFLFDNWPHPRGVVRAHETLAAAAYYQPLFRKEREQAKPPLPPAFVLDRRRLAPYTDDAKEFDNRFTAKLPSAEQWRALGVTRLLYVVPSRADASVELDDLNDDFTRASKNGVEVRALSLDLFGVEALADAGSSPSDRLVREAGSVWYGGSSGAHPSFFLDYPWATPPRRATSRVTPNPGASYAPSPRATAFSDGRPLDPTARPTTRPANFGTVPVVVALGTGALLGARYSRSGSWNRASGGWGG